MKFDIYNTDTWKPAPRDLEASLNNKAIGAIGQKVSEIRALKQKIEKNLNFNDQDDYRIANLLLGQNPDAYNIMHISIDYSGDKVASALKAIDFILDYWKTTTTGDRASTWRRLIPHLETLKPYLERDYYGHVDSNKVLKTTVTGNAAWDVYLREVRAISVYSARLKKAESSISTMDDEEPSSEDYEAEDSDSEDD